MRIVMGLRLAPVVALIVLGACTDSGPPTESQISEDIQSDLWTRNQLSPVVPGMQPPATTGDESKRIIP